nr:EAL domain-containing protein [Tepidicella baoligensis]
MIHHVTPNLLTALAYAMGGWLSLQAAVPPDYISVLFIAAGIAVGAVLAAGNRVLPGVWAGALAVQWLAHAQAGLDWGWTLWVAPFGAAAQAWITAEWIRRRIGYPSALDQPLQVVMLMFVCLPLGSMVNASLSVPALVVDGAMPWSELPGAWFTWWLGDALGAVLFAPLVLVCCGQPAEAWRPRLLTVAMPMALAMGLIGVMFYQINASHQRVLANQFDQSGQELAQRLQRRLDVQTDSVEAIAKLMELAPHMSQADFESATQPWLHRYPGTQNFGWSPLITRERRLAYEQGAVDPGMPGYAIMGRDWEGRISPAAQADSHLPITWVAPLESNRSVLGLDVSVLPATAAAVRATVENQRPAVTEGIRLVQESGEQRGVVMYLAVFEPRHADDPMHPGARGLKGVVSSVFRMDDVLEAALGRIDPQQIALCLYDPSARVGNQRLAGPEGCENAPSVSLQEQRWIKEWPLAIGDREWTLRLQAGPAFWGLAGQNSAWATSITGLIAVAILGAFLIVITGLGRRTAKLVAERTQELAHSNAALTQMAHYDALTGLANRPFWTVQAEAALAASRDSGKRVGVIFLDVDRFKHINDSLGHTQGDQLLVTIGARIHECLRSRDVLARIGGDEFVALLPGLRDPEGAATVARKISRVLSVPVMLEGMQIKVTASLGVAIFPEHGETVEELLRHADTAMYAAKAAGRNQWRFFTADMHERVSQRLAMEAGLRLALEPGAEELQLVYQPQVNAATGEVIGLEALLRWNHPTFGPVPPSVFIPIAEDSGIIENLGQWVLREVCRQVQAWQTGPDAAWFRDMSVAVNVSAAEFARPQFLDHLLEVVDDLCMGSMSLELEITESLLVQANGEISTRMRTITGMGIGLSLDDFGTGYSSLGYLKRLPLSKLKIDRSFLHGIPGDPENEAIVRATLSMAHDLGLMVVAEGVETAGQRDFLLAHGCAACQGWLYAKALTPAELAAWLRQRQASGPPATAFVEPPQPT